MVLSVWRQSLVVGGMAVGFVTGLSAQARFTGGRAGAGLFAPSLDTLGVLPARPVAEGAVRHPTTAVPGRAATGTVRVALPHGDHDAVSRALIDPTFTHHAILEDELRVNFSSRSSTGSGTSDVATLELAYAFNDALGAEVFLPLALRRADGAPRGRLLDIEAQPLKWSFLRRYNLVMTAVAGVVIPAGPVADDGERNWRFEPHFFTDAAIGPIAAQGNVIASFASDGEQELELLASAAHMFFFSPFNAVGPVVEAVWEIPLNGEPGVRTESALAPGLKVQLGGWYFGASYLFPLRARSDVPRELALAAGYHVSFSRRRPPSTEADPPLPASIRGAAPR